MLQKGVLKPKAGKTRPLLSIKNCFRKKIENKNAKNLYEKRKCPRVLDSFRNVTL
jgi:hypothetical protein